jgi:hypothetical protein
LILIEELDGLDRYYLFHAARRFAAPARLRSGHGGGPPPRLGTDANSAERAYLERRLAAL